MSKIVDHADKMIIYYNNSVFCIPVEFAMNDLNLRDNSAMMPESRTTRDLIAAI